MEVTREDIANLLERKPHTAERKDDLPRYGIVHNLGSFNPLRIALHEYCAIARDVLRRDLTWLQRFAYFLGPPGVEPRREPRDHGAVARSGRSLANHIRYEPPIGLGRLNRNLHPSTRPQSRRGSSFAAGHDQGIDRLRVTV
jgi:hypothetical protein